MISLLRKLVLPGLLGLSLFMAGCLEEKDTLTVYPDGSGTIHLHRRFGEQISGMITSFADKNNPQAAIEKNFYKDLSQWSGVTAWTDCKATLDGKCIVNEATGFFNDVSKLKQTEGKNTQSFSWTNNADGGFTLTWSSDNQAGQNPLDQPSLPPEQIQQMLTMMKGLKVEHEIVMPSAVTTATGCHDHKDRSASSITTDDDIAKAFAIIDDYRRKVDKGDMPKAQANTEIKAKLQDMSMNMQVACEPGNIDDEFAQFRKDYDKAKADYALADTAKKIQDATKGEPAPESAPAPDKTDGK